MSDLIIKTNQLTKKFKTVTALEDVNMEIKQGQIYGLVGKNGAGKTTLLRLITGQSNVSQGEISLFGTTGVKIEAQRKRIGSIIEMPAFFPYLTAKQNLEYYRIQRGIPGKDIVDETLQEVGLADTGNKKFKSFSLGMKQRLGLALAIMNKPELLLLDEPINGLDPFGIIEIRNLLLKLNREKNVTILISSHILSELENLVTDYGFIDKGRLIKQLSAEELSAECCRYMEVKVDNTEKMTALLETKISCRNYKVVPDGSIHIYENLDKPNLVSELAISSGIELYGIHVKEMNLENYFIQLVGGESNE